MTKPVNLYLLSRIREEEVFARVERHASGSADKKNIRQHEMGSLRALTEGLLAEGLPLEALDGWFLGYSIPRIGKEFDLLKFTGRRCLNIELKSQAVPLADIAAQLRRNRHYLRHLERETRFFTLVSDTMTVYRLTAGDGLEQVPFSQLAQACREMETGWVGGIDKLFRASDYLVSPLSTPGKFIRREYFLTQPQEQIKRNLLREASEQGGLFAIGGLPGTGKTLLLYDLARELAERGPTLLLTYGPLTAGQKHIGRAIPRLTLLPHSSRRCGAELEKARFILVDESHRLEPRRFEEIRAAMAREGCAGVFSADPHQMLTRREQETDIPGRIRALPLTGDYTLTEKLRANRELASFIQGVSDLSQRVPGGPSYENVALAYGETREETEKLVDYYRRRGYVYLNYGAGDGRDIRRVLGREFNKVLLVLGPTFYYDARGRLRGGPHPDPELQYDRLFYQAVTRAREKLALVVSENPPLLEKISTLVDVRRDFP